MSLELRLRPGLPVGQEEEIRGSLCLLILQLTRVLQGERAHWGYDLCGGETQRRRACEPQTPERQRGHQSYKHSS